MTGQRIVGVLIEKELTVPDTYPLTLAGLVAGCNQKSNREPFVTFEEWQIEGALQQLRADGYVIRVDGGRATRYRHAVDDRFGLGLPEKAVLAELLVRGPQAPGALKTRVARMGYDAASPEDVREVLVAMRDRVGGPLVVQLARQPREREARWAHELGDPADRGAGGAGTAVADDEPVGGASEVAAATGARGREEHADDVDGEGVGRVDRAGLVDRVTELEARVAELERRLDELTS
jgi:uncharacterized protein YceH (UPF0502 family)